MFISLYLNIFQCLSIRRGCNTKFEYGWVHVYLCTRTHMRYIYIYICICTKKYYIYIEKISVPSSTFPAATI